jgi:hypothetical protein
MHRGNRSIIRAIVIMTRFISIPRDPYEAVRGINTECNFLPLLIIDEQGDTVKRLRRSPTPYTSEEKLNVTFFAATMGRLMNRGK